MVISFVVITGISFYAGTKVSAYGKSGMMFNSQARAGGYTAGMMNGARGARGGMMNGGLVAGDIIAKDATSVTIKLRDGGSKIVFYSPITSIAKTIDGTSDDVSIGKQVTIIGTPNADGSVNATSIQIRTAPKQ